MADPGRCRPQVDAWRFVLAALAGLVLGVGCDRSGAPRATTSSALGADSALPVLAAGDFLPAGWLDLALLERLRAERGRRLVPAWLLALRSGWSRPESWGVFGLGTGSSLDLHLLDADARELLVDCGPPEVPEARAQTVAVRINDRPIGSLEVPAHGWHRLRLAVGDGVLHPGTNRVDFAYAHHLDLGSRDARPLALAVRRLGLVPRGSEPAGDETPVGQAPPPFKVDRARDALFLTAAGTFLVPYDVPTSGAALRFDVHRRDWPGTDPRRLVVLAITLDGERHPLATSAGDGPLRIDLDAFAGRRLTLAFETRPPAGARLYLRTPRRIETVPATAQPSAATRKPATTQPSATATSTAPRPHILLVILDALRADHVGAYGYHRATTPRIDALAREGLVFTNLVAECPYTACSSPTILSGVPFIDHGVVDLGQRIRPGIETLAQRLAALGYRTVGFSGNPNNSSATGGDRGFDEYYESWRIFRKHAESRQRWHPETLTNLVIERLEQGFGEQPSLVMVHYVPPHEPYAPDPEFDIFKDPNYTGKISSDKKQTRSIFNGDLRLDAADRGRLMSLYDGNLRQADHHLGRLFDAYRHAGLWDDTLVVVTSDHGEAFGEHENLYGHNKSLYRTMMHVPLIVRLPTALAPAHAPRRDRFASLASVVPTLLGRLGETPAAGVTGIDLLALTDREPSAARDGLLILERTAHADVPVWGLESVRFHAMARARRWARLFDRAADPDQRQDVSAGAPYLWTGMVLRIERTLATGHRSEDGVLSEEDRKMLESLGYTGG